MKKKFAFAALTVAACCAVTLSGCGGQTIVNTAALSSNWYAFTTYKKIQPDFVGEENAEKAEYKVTYSESEIPNSSYSVEFPKEGSYKTLFYALDFDYENLTDGDYKAAYAEKADKKAIQAYYYKTELSMPEMLFKRGAESTKILSESIVTECYFLPVADSLRPLYSKISVYSHSPADYRTDSSIENVYRVVDRVYDNYYSYDGRSVKTKITYGKDDYKYSEQPSYSVNDRLADADNVLFDNYSLNIAVRSMNLAADLSQNISLFAPNSGIQNYALTGSDGEMSDDELSVYTSILKSKYSLKDTIKSVAVRVQYIGDISGVSQKLWFAAIPDKTNNKPRATMLKLSEPLPYGLGTLNYTLKSIS